MILLVYPYNCRPSLKRLERLRTLIDMFASNVASNVADAGHLFAMLASASSLSPTSRMAEVFMGMTQVNLMTLGVTRSCFGLTSQ